MSLVISKICFVCWARWQAVLKVCKHLIVWTDWDAFVRKQKYQYTNYNVYLKKYHLQHSTCTATYLGRDWRRSRKWFNQAFSFTQHKIWGQKAIVQVSSGQGKKWIPLAQWAGKFQFSPPPLRSYLTTNKLNSTCPVTWASKFQFSLAPTKCYLPMWWAVWKSEDKHEQSKSWIPN